MILVREIFHLKFGKAKEAKEQIKAMKELFKKNNDFEMGRVMTDLTGRSYTLVMETEFENLGDFESKLKEGFADKQWQELYQKFIPLIDNSIREIYTIID